MKQESIQIQCILTSNKKERLSRSMDSLAKALELYRSATEQNFDALLCFGDVSPIATFSEAEATAIANKYRPYFSLQYRFFGSSPTENAHNRLAKSCKADYVMIMQPDIFVSARFFIDMLKSFGSFLKVGMVEARQTPSEHPKEYDKLTGETPRASDVCFIMTTKLFQDVYGYVESTCDPNNDVELSCRIRKLGYRIIYQPLSPVYTDMTTFDGNYTTYSEDIHMTPASNSVFLSVITRTQGKRPEALREVLLCLTAQSNTDFEVLIMGHKLSQEQQLLVRNILEDTPSWIRNKIQFIQVDHGSRATPLNIGFKIARGRYISILDDDDLVFANWVESFYTLSRKHPDSILHAYSVSQNYRAVETPSGIDALCACGPYSKLYCRDFDPIRQLDCNACPSGGIAYPSYAVQKLNIRFNEQLQTTEDWDFLMRTSFICGVSDTPQVTFLYRIWLNRESSRSLHDENEWLKNHAAVQEGFNKLPMLLPPGSASKIIQLLHRFNQIFGSAGLTGDLASALYIDTADGFTEECVIYSYLDFSGAAFACRYDGLEKFKCKKLRWDPSDNGGYFLEHIKIEIALSDGSSHQLDTASLSCNGVILGNKIVFLESDPQIYFPLPEGKDYTITGVIITGSISFELFSCSMETELTKAIQSLAEQTKTDCSLLNLLKKWMQKLSR